MANEKRSAESSQTTLNVVPLTAAEARAAELAKDVVDSTAASSVDDHKSELASVEEKGNVWDGYLDDDLPEKTNGRVVRNLRFQIFSLYRRLFGIVFITNMGIFINEAVRGTTAMHLGTIVIANLFVSILMRQEYVINAFFTVACLAPLS